MSDLELYPIYRPIDTNDSSQTTSHQLQSTPQPQPQQKLYPEPTPTRITIRSLFKKLHTFAKVHYSNYIIANLGDMFNCEEVYNAITKKYPDRNVKKFLSLLIVVWHCSTIYSRVEVEWKQFSDFVGTVRLSGIDIQNTADKYIDTYLAHATHILLRNRFNQW